MSGLQRFPMSESVVDTVVDAVPPVDDTTATAAVEIEPVVAELAPAEVAALPQMETTAAIEPALAEPVPVEPALVESVVEAATAEPAAAAVEATSVDDNAARRAEQLRGLFQTARDDGTSAPLAEDGDNEANRGA